MCRYYFQQIHPIDCNYHPQRGEGRNIEAIKADLDFIRVISGTASGASLLPKLLQHLPSSINQLWAHFLQLWAQPGAEQKGKTKKEAEASSLQLGDESKMMLGLLNLLTINCLQER